jgi:hypothetical protein
VVGPAVVFVHGLAGNPAKSWGKMISVCATDPAFDNYSLSCFSYPSKRFRIPFTSPIARLQELARGLETELETLHSERREVILVAHSLGGLIVRQYVMNAVKSNRPFIATKLMLFAVPNTGSALAAAAKTVPWDNGVLEQLGFNSDILDMLNEDWVRYAVETKLPVQYVVGGADTIVKPESARPFYGQDNVSTLVGQTHRSIVDATGIDDIRYAVLQKFALGNFDLYKPAEIAKAEPAPLHRPADPLFDLYSAKDAEYYVHRDCDLFLTRGMSTGHVWVSYAMWEDSAGCLQTQYRDRIVF